MVAFLHVLIQKTPTVMKVWPTRLMIHRGKIIACCAMDPWAGIIPSHLFSLSLSVSQLPAVFSAVSKPTFDLETGRALSSKDTDSVLSERQKDWTKDWINLTPNKKQANNNGLRLLLFCLVYLFIYWLFIKTLTAVTFSIWLWYIRMEVEKKIKHPIKSLTLTLPLYAKKTRWELSNWFLTWWRVWKNQCLDVSAILCHVQGRCLVSSDVANVVFGLQGLVAGEGPRQKVPQEVINSVEMDVLKTGLRVKRQQGAHSEKDRDLISEQWR